MQHSKRCLRASGRVLFYQPRSGMVKGRCGLLLLFSKKTFVELFCFGSKLVWVLVSHLSYLTFFSISAYLICCCSVRRLLFDLFVIIDISHVFYQPRSGMVMQNCRSKEKRRLKLFWSLLPLILVFWWNFLWYFGIITTLFFIFCLVLNFYINKT